MKLFNTNNTETVKARQVLLSFELLSDQLADRFMKCETRENSDTHLRLFGLCVRLRTPCDMCLSVMCMLCSVGYAQHSQL